MGRMAKQEHGGGGSDAFLCHCGVRMQDAFWPYRGKPAKIIHCQGGVGFRKNSGGNDVHHGRFEYHCWHCGKRLGCDQCLGAITEVLCRLCAAWGTPEALAEHGPVLNTDVMVAKRNGTMAPALADYPPTFRAAYHDALMAEQEVAPIPAASLNQVVKIVSTCLATDPKERSVEQEVCDLLDGIEDA